MLSLTPLELEALGLSLQIAFWSVLVSLPFAIAVGHLLSRREFYGKWLIDGIVHLPLVLPPVVVGYGLLLLFGRTGPLGQLLNDWFGISIAFTWTGAAVAAAVMSFPLMVRAIRLAIDAIDTDLEEAAGTLGAGPVRVFATITLPLMAPGILTGTVLGFARCLGEFGATITFVSNIPGETRTIPLALYSLAQTPGDEWPAMRLAILSVVVALVALAGSEFMARRIRRRLTGRGGERA